MAIISLNKSYNMMNNDGFYVATTENFISGNNSEIVFRSPKNTIQHYTGSFEGDFIVGVTGGTLTGFIEYEPNDSTLIWSVTNFVVPYDTYFAFANANNSLGLLQYTMSGADSINGSEQGDTLRGFEGNDTIFGNAGNDDVNGNQGMDSIWGGFGNDTLFGGRNSDFLQGNQGIDMLNGNNFNDTVLGGKDADTVRGGKDDDYVNGNNGNDWVSGDKGNDTVRGGKEDDMVFGADGNDFLYGDLGNDTLNGGAGADVFVYNSNSGIDIITDFSSGDLLKIKTNLNETNITDFSTLQKNITTTGNGLSIDLGSGNSLELTGLSVLESSDVVFF